MQLIEFILKAKLAGYANNAEEQKIKFPDDSVGFKYITEHFDYLDRYYGSNPFTGSEQVSNKEDSLIWTMNYFGGVTSNDESLGEIYSFLKEAMSLITQDYPFRGPKEYQSDRFQYKNEQEGTIERFNGIEHIYSDNKQVYTLHYHGGTLKIST
jgi:Domain of unknown function (DUF5680)